MLVIENCNSLSELRQKLIDGEEVRTVRQEPCEDVIRREDAINAVSEALEHVVVENEDVAKKMINKLPSVKLQQPCADAISRQTAIDALQEVSEHYTEKGREWHPHVNFMVDAIKGLPPVNPQSKTGHWIPVSEELPDKEGYYLCSVRYMYPPYNFFEPEKVKYMDDVTIQKFDGEFNIEVKAWMPLPPCYRPQESEDKE